MSADPLPQTPAWPPKSAPRLFVEEMVQSGESVRIVGNQAHYLSKVMRVSNGDAIILCDDQSGEWACAVRDISKREVVVEPCQKLREREDVPDFWLCPALLKKDRFDLVLEKATELGVRQIHPVLMRRCVANKLNLDRARTLTIEAAEQCARTALPSLHEPCKLEQMLGDWPTERTLFFADEARDAQPAASAFAKTDGPAALLIGPEGGAIAATALWMGGKGDWIDAQ